MATNSREHPDIQEPNDGGNPNSPKDDSDGQKDAPGHQEGFNAQEGSNGPKGSPNRQGGSNGQNIPNGQEDMDILMPIYKRNESARNGVIDRIKKHINIKKLWRRKVTKAVVRNTGWHGEPGSNDGNSSRHVTVDFFTGDDHVTTHHVYQNDSDYPGPRR
ncbi:hypothetical protein P691DRAFT_785293 [Macrolepiota fuliginosa MF-IS2]|uniref:Uncharacterized protein n=1 Tax=Macrolepiota fuliginosa MF-IS2 TaxID=1400762 RepID=A0A9P6BYP4_9AGAR|nr:hypothetical protein P691DRAFT_785293 [Macrolepiota fuliginosa MF-IS2]